MTTAPALCVNKWMVIITYCVCLVYMTWKVPVCLPKKNEINCMGHFLPKWSNSLPWITAHETVYLIVYLAVAVHRCWTPVILLVHKHSLSYCQMYSKTYDVPLLYVISRIFSPTVSQDVYYYTGLQHHTVEINIMLLVTNYWLTSSVLVIRKLYPKVTFLRNVGQHTSICRTHTTKDCRCGRVWLRVDYT